jgi:hypothetical protein
MFKFTSFVVIPRDDASTPTIMLTRKSYHQNAESSVNDGRVQ